MFAPCPFIQEKLDFLCTPSLFLNSFCLNKSRSMPKLRFLRVCKSPGTLTEENVCKVVSNNTEIRKKKKTTTSHWVCLAKNLVKAEQAGLENKSLAKQCSCREVSSLFRPGCSVLVKWRTYFSNQVPTWTEEGLLIIWCMLFCKMSTSVFVYWVAPR